MFCSYKPTEWNECIPAGLSCGLNFECVKNQSGQPSCACRSGYVRNGSHCLNTNECALSTHQCHQQADCTDSDGSYDCHCRRGFTGNGTMCTNIDECSLSPNSCDINSDCFDFLGSFRCRCHIGFHGDGLPFCNGTH